MYIIHVFGIQIVILIQVSQVTLLKTLDESIQGMGRPCLVIETKCVLLEVFLNVVLQTKFLQFLLKLRLA